VGYPGRTVEGINLGLAFGEMSDRHIINPICGVGEFMKLVARIIWLHANQAPLRSIRNLWYLRSCNFSATNQVVKCNFDGTKNLGT
jgi:hypothetical protein